MSSNPGRLQFMLDRKKDLYGVNKQFVLSLLYTKSHEWAYKQEHRTIADLQVQDPQTGFYYVDFGPNSNYAKSYWELGIMPLGKMAKLVRKNERQVLVFKSRPAFQEFAMVRNMSVKAISVPACQ